MIEDALIALGERAKKRRDHRTMKRFGITDKGELTWDGTVLKGEWECPQPFDDCRPGACNCSGLIDRWRWDHDG